jgi:hypothetical protein
MNASYANSVKYLIIGGYAVIQYAEARYTIDADLLSQIPD